MMWVDYKLVDLEADDYNTRVFIVSEMRIAMNEFDHRILGLIIDPQNDRLPVGLIAQLVEHCTGIAEVRVRIPVQA